MDWRKFTKVFLGTVVMGTILGILIGVIVLGAFGYFLAGKEGLINMSIWGLVLGLVGGFLSGLIPLFDAKYWSEYVGRYGAYWFKRQAEGDSKAPEVKDSGWPQ